jgi:hypothetical protein
MERKKRFIVGYGSILNLGLELRMANFAHSFKFKSSRQKSNVTHLFLLG